MACRRSREMLGLSLSALETVATDTPNSRAMSFIVMCLELSILMAENYLSWFIIEVGQFLSYGGEDRTKKRIAQTIAFI
jgi:hypothetical protein